MVQPAHRPPFRFSRVDTSGNTQSQFDSDSLIDFNACNSFIRGLSGASFRMSTREGAIVGPNSRENASMTIRDCRNTEFIMDEPLQLLHAYNLVGCSIFIHGVRGSVHVSNSSGTSIKGYCSQLRITDCNDIEVRVQTFSSTALVNSRNIRVGAPPEISSGSSHGNPNLDLIGFNKKEFLMSSRWKNVKDFDCLSENSPNWSFIQ